MKTESERPRRGAHAAALALLAAREYSRAQLARKLAQREYGEDEISSALAALAADGYLSDERAAEAAVRNGLRRGHGPNRIRADLREAGLPNGVAVQESDQAPVDWVLQARALAERRFGADPPTDYTEWAKRARFLQSRGYASETIRKALAKEAAS